jgi:hypothetical protein
VSISISKPAVGGSYGTWGTELNTALDVIVNGVNAVESAASTKMPLSTFSAKGDLAVGTGAGLVSRAGVGTNGFVLVADSSTGTGVAWKLPPGSIVARFSQTSGQSIGSGGAGAAVTWTVVYDRFGVMTNGASVYTPNVAGYYEISGGVGYAVNGTGMRMVWLQSGGADVPGSADTQPAQVSFEAAVPIRPTVMLMNGSTDNVSVIAYQNSGASLSLATATRAQPTMTVKWLGP